MSDQPDEMPKVLRDLFGWYSMSLLAVGLRSGLLDALLAGPGTAEVIATRAGVDRRNAYEWLRGMTAAEHASHAGGEFTLAEGTAQALGPHFPVDARAVLAIPIELPLVFDQVLDAIGSGRGVPSDVYAGVGAAAGGINTPIYAAALVSEWIEGAAGLGERLRAGGAIADLGAGNGDAAAMVATAYPNARVVGYDVVPTDRSDLPENLRMSTADVRRLPDDGPFDLVYCLDAFHHLGSPVEVLEQIRGVLADDGVVMIAETAMSGDLEQDVADPFALVVYGAGLLYCLQESLSAGGEAHSGGDGTAWIEKALAAAGFGAIRTTPSETGYAIITASPKPSQN